ncbi:hypothetical protein J577_2517 [Acinetobacter sp. 263903-1]|jgi:hypothetical protein|uniref:Uncharacterized protein n=1 Tax=Acinetobacter radioresistens SK82 TaxID=596318 RepID=A0ABM9YRD8_ACIRA|nr:hypothetical protein ACIRA0001_2472 [Acinetobacter radioresistens SK82]EEY87926.1 hypothetical protein HMPREF0018_00673 [Acinetobacter radioresistens SH164]ENV86763.1 hypothetical protein F940_00720 [Acinetobacter radioresistens NIPH 2130]EXB34269.1 hypothetical protein J546_1052 [Acinetobacter sp. 1461402]EXB73815.1 hypothetical protein J550_0072 [Acinetobacter sp. 230853]EXB83700.1 hypothetical protein J538_2100 [Acinetobacter sp. 272263]EXE61048.1 hypothetical protein J579_0375 [Acineto
MGLLSYSPIKLNDFFVDIVSALQMLIRQNGVPPIEVASIELKTQNINS